MVHRIVLENASLALCVRIPDFNLPSPSAILQILHLICRIFSSRFVAHTYDFLALLLWRGIWQLHRFTDAFSVIGCRPPNAVSVVISTYCVHILLSKCLQLSWKIIEVRAIEWLPLLSLISERQNVRRNRALYESVIWLHWLLKSGPWFYMSCGIELCWELRWSKVERTDIFTGQRSREYVHFVASNCVPCVFYTDSQYRCPIDKCTVWKFLSAHYDGACLGDIPVHHTSRRIQFYCGTLI
jgi:hypothetical protein